MSTSDIPDILINFFDYLSIQNYSKETISVYTYDLMDFFKFIKFNKRIHVEVKDFSYILVSNIQSEDIISYLYFLNDVKENIAITRYRKYCEIKVFFNYLVKLYPDFTNPALDLMHFTDTVRVPKYLNLEQAKKIQNVFNEYNSKYPLRNNTIISFFLSTGIRVSELRGINIEDIDFENNTVNIKVGKGNKSRIAYFSNKCKKILLKYINSRESKIIDLKSPLFLSKNNKRLSRRSIEVICENAFKLLGLQGKHFNAHTLRHTTATLTYNYVNQDIVLIKELLGHATVASTNIYTHVNPEKVKKAVESNPLANFIPSSSKEGKNSENGF